MIQSIIVVGSGTAGLMAALALKRKIPQLNVTVVRSTDVGVIGVGESTTPQFVEFLFNYLGLTRKQFYAIARPTWKTGIHFLWGPRPAFEFAFQYQLDGQWSNLSHPNGYYCDDSFDAVNLNAALMAQGKAFPAQPDGSPDITGYAAFHLFNPTLVKALETVAIQRGIQVIEAKITGHTMSPNGIQSILAEDGRSFSADLFIDASGFRSELLGKALQTPFLSYDNALYCDRAILGSWPITDTDPIDPYTTAETMDAGWCWKIDHEHIVNRGYVYSSRFLSEDAAREEFARKNPRAKLEDRTVKFISGRYREGWVKNVVALGNACGFVEPLEATALMVASSQIQTFVDILIASQLKPTPGMVRLYNDSFRELWDHIRDFLSIHYKFNTRIQNDFWRTCNHEVDVSPLQPLLDFYAENGPTGFGRHFLNSTLAGKTQFGIEGFLVMLVGMKVPYTPHDIPPAEHALFQQHCAQNRQQAAKGLTVKQALQYVHHPNWSWHADTQT